MRSPDSRVGYRPGKTFEEELNLRYLSPGAFTVLSPEDHGSPPDPPQAPHPYRLTPAGKRNRNQAFSIIAEPPPRSRSPSPSGRVSPFRGRGFNPNGSRHASPASSPPPDETRSRSVSRKRSQIPKLKRRDSSVLSTEDDDDSSPKFRRKNVSVLKPQLSKSLNYIGPKPVSSKPPISPRKFPSVVQNKAPVFNRLSPIIGSSPEPSSDSKSQSSPSRIPTKSRSTPPSRKASPNRDTSKTRHTSRTSSRSNSRDSSPSKLLSPTRIPSRNYKNVQSKVNSYANKTKVPNKTQENGSRVEDNNNQRTNLQRNNSVKKINNKPTKTVNNNNINKNNNTPSVSKSNSNNNLNKKASNSTNNLSNINKNSEVKPRDKVALIKAAAATKRATNAMKASIESKNENTKSTPSGKTTKTDTIKKVESASKLQDLLPSASTVVSSTTTTVTQPLKIEAKLDTPVKISETPTNTRKDEDKLKIKETPMYMDEGRILSAKSVSSAIERMNDTVLDSQTLLKDHNLTKLTPSHASVTIPHANENVNKGFSSAVPSVETVSNPVDVLSQNVNNSVSSVSNNVENNVKNSFNKVVANDDTSGAKVNNYEMSANERIKEARTLVAADVKPIRITVQEKPNNDDVQSGNVRFPPNATTNGTTTGAGAPHPHENGSHEEIVEDKPQGRCGNFMKKCREKLTCTCCKKQPKVEEESDKPKGCFQCLKRKRNDEGVDDDDKKGCFGCLKKKKKEVEEVIVVTDENVEKKKSCLDRLKCCRGNKIGDNSSDTGCFGRSKKKKDTWVDRRDSILSEQPPLTRMNRCKNFFKKIFYCGCTCCKRKPPPQKVIEDSRRASLMSKKKSLTPTVLPPEEPKNRLDTSLVEYTSTMKAAIPVLPVALAYFCLVLNIFAPGTGTVFSGLFCLCMGIPRFSQKDGPKPRFGSFIINTIIGCGQLFTVLFCLVGWGWSIWWGVIMLKVAKKHRKLKKIEARMEAQQAKGGSTTNVSKRDVEKGRS